MQRNLWIDNFRAKLTKNKYILIFLSLGLLSWYLFDVFYRPTYTHTFPFTQGEHVWDVDVRKGCTYDLGFYFIVPDDYTGDLNKVFGDPYKLKSLPVSFTIGIINPYGTAMLMSSPGGKRVSSFSYDDKNKKINLKAYGGGYNKESNSLAFVFARLGMSPGNYKVKLNITEEDVKLEQFKASMFLSSNIKFRCS